MLFLRSAVFLLEIFQLIQEFCKSSLNRLALTNQLCSWYLDSISLLNQFHLLRKILFSRFDPDFLRLLLHPVQIPDVIIDPLGIALSLIRHIFRNKGILLIRSMSYFNTMYRCSAMKHTLIFSGQFGRIRQKRKENAETACLQSTSELF